MISPRDGKVTLFSPARRAALCMPAYCAGNGIARGPSSACELRGVIAFGGMQMRRAITIAVVVAVTFMTFAGIARSRAGNMGHPGAALGRRLRTVHRRTVDIDSDRVYGLVYR